MSETQNEAPKYDRVGQIMAYEQGELDTPEVIALFQNLIADGTAFRLQGSYGRAAVALIEAGVVTETGELGPKGQEILDA